MKSTKTEKLTRSDLTFIIYYGILLLLLSTWNDVDNLPSMPLRFAFTFAVILPLFFYRSVYYPVILITFVIISAERHAASFMMFHPMYIAVVTIIDHFFFKNKRARHTPPRELWVMLVLCTLSDLLNYSSFHLLSYTLLSIIILSQYVIQDEKLYKLWTFSWILISVMLSIDFQLFGAEFIERIIIYGMEFERMGWSDPNYFSGVLSIGCVLSFFELLNRSHHRVLRVMFGCCFALIFISMLSMASRGAILGVALTVLAYLLLSNERKSTKVMATIFICAFTVYLMNSGLFDFVEARFLNDDGTGSGRSTIWSNKISRFLDSDNLIHLFIGYGYEGGMRLGSNAREIGFHNDFVAFVVEYGFMGWISFMSLFALLIRDVKRRRTVFSLMVLFLVLCFTLEPLTSGRFVFWFYWLYIYFIGHNSLYKTSDVYNTEMK